MGIRHSLENITVALEGSIVQTKIKTIYWTVLWELSIVQFDTKLTTVYSTVLS